MAYLLVGKKTEGDRVLPPGPETLPGEVYRISMTIDNLIPITSFTRLQVAATKVKQNYPMVNVSAIEVVDSKVYIEYYDAPGVQFALVAAAVVVALSIIFLVVLQGTITELIKTAKEIVGSPLLLLLVAGVLVVVGLYGYGYIVNAPKQRQGG